ncbi:MAG: hypothetical protein H0X31_20580 [Nostocaceae cyanobacterium]|nr:hypothetical protein [Nostocaceae cyanobacterium]
MASASPSQVKAIQISRFCQPLVNTQDAQAVKINIVKLRISIAQDK